MSAETKAYIRGFLEGIASSMTLFPKPRYTKEQLVIKITDPKQHLQDVWTTIGDCLRQEAKNVDVRERRQANS